MTLLTTNHDQLKWYIDTKNGLVGPFNTPEEANMTNMMEGLNGAVVSRTDSGHSILLG